MTYKEARKILYEKYTERPTIVRALEFDKYFGFLITAPDSSIGEGCFVGGSLVCVQKQSKEIFKEEIPDVDFSEARLIEDKENNDDET